MNTGMPAGMPSLRSHSAWPELVHEEQQDEERGELPAPEQRVRTDGDDHRHAPW